jgi:hypothetical protein
MRLTEGWNPKLSLKNHFEQHTKQGKEGFHSEIEV